MPRPRRGWFIYKREDRSGWYLYFDRDHRVSLATDDEHEAQRRAALRCGEFIEERRQWARSIDNAPPASPTIADVADAQTDARRRRILIAARGPSCESCKRQRWQGQPIPLEMDHIDGNSDNNAADNLRLLCPNCHALTPTHRGRNKGKTSSTRNALRRRDYRAGRLLAKEGEDGLRKRLGCAALPCQDRTGQRLQVDGPGILAPGTGMAPLPDGA